MAAAVIVGGATIVAALIGLIKPGSTDQAGTSATSPSAVQSPPRPPAASGPANGYTEQSHMVRNQTTAFILNRGYGIDLDSKSSGWGANSSWLAGLDLQLDLNGTLDHAAGRNLFPVPNRDAYVTWDVCNGAQANGATLNLGQPSAGEDFCVLTDNNRLSFVHVNSVQMRSDGSGDVVNLFIVTFE